MNETFALMLLLALLSGAPHQGLPGNPVAVSAPPHATASPGALAQRARRAQAARLQPRVGARLPLEASFTDAAGRTQRLAHYFSGTPVLLVLGHYRCPGPCGTIMDGILQSVAALDLPAGEFRVLAVSIDPSEDAPLAARKQASYRRLPGGAALQLDLLTGGAAEIARLAAAIGYDVAVDAARPRLLAPAGFLVAAADGTITRYFPDMRFEGRDLRLALVQASRGTAGDLSDRVVLMYSRFDQASGRYTGVARRMAGTGAVLALALLATGGWLLRRRWRRGMPGSRARVRPASWQASPRPRRREADRVGEP
jgi:protein SCO1/2